jgi:hypothetical protein
VSQGSGVEGLWGSIMSITEYFPPHFAELSSKREHRLHLVPTSGKARDLALLFSHTPQTPMTCTRIAAAKLKKYLISAVSCANPPSNAIEALSRETVGSVAATQPSRLSNRRKRDIGPHEMVHKQRASPRAFPNRVPSTFRYYTPSLIPDDLSTSQTHRRFAHRNLRLSPVR